jgi:RNA-directed DNA polymerase
MAIWDPLESLYQARPINTDPTYYTCFCYVVGGAMSPLLSNIMLDPLDKELEKRGHQFARYADDFTILVKTPRAGDRVLSSISRFLSHRLKLVVNTTKSHVVKTSESKFL